jgi:hypothetical protein
MDIRPSQVISDEELFPKFCFFVEFDLIQPNSQFFCDQLVSEEIGLRLIMTDRFLSEDQIKCFDNLSNYNNLFSTDCLNYNLNY